MVQLGMLAILGQMILGLVVVPLGCLAVEFVFSVL